MKLSDTIEKPIEFYSTLENPQFVGQSKVNSEGYYYMVFEEKGVYYSFKHKL